MFNATANDMWTFGKVCNYEEEKLYVIWEEKKERERTAVKKPRLTLVSVYKKSYRSNLLFHIYHSEGWMISFDPLFIFVITFSYSIVDLVVLISSQTLKTEIVITLFLIFPIGNRTRYHSSEQVFYLSKSITEYSNLCKFVLHIRENYGSFH